MNNNIQEVAWSEKQRVLAKASEQVRAGESCSGMNVILVDADYVDKVAFDLIVNFERMIGRRIPQADFAKWIDCVALDGGIRQGEQETQVVLVHKKGSQRMENFLPGHYADELDGKAFKDHLGEFCINAFSAEDITGEDHYFIDALQLLTAQKEVRRMMVIPNAEDEYIINKVRETLRLVDDDDRRITVFAMQPLTGGNFRQEILGYSLMAALGIRSEEINTKIQ